MQFAKALCLIIPFLRRGDDDDHVGTLVGMMVLVGYVIDIVGGWIRRRTERSYICHVAESSRDIVEPYRSARDTFYVDRNYDVALIVLAALCKEFFIIGEGSREVTNLLIA